MDVKARDGLLAEWHSLCHKPEWDVHDAREAIRLAVALDRKGSLSSGENIHIRHETDDRTISFYLEAYYVAKVVCLRLKNERPSVENSDITFNEFRNELKSMVG